MLTVLITRGQIIIRAGYFSCSLPVSQGGNSSRQLAGVQAGCGAEGADTRPLPNATGSIAEGEDTEESSQFGKADGGCVLLLKQRGAVDHAEF